MRRTDAREAITQAHHDGWARVVASLTRRFGDLDIAEESAAGRCGLSRPGETGLGRTLYTGS